MTYASNDVLGYVGSDPPWACSAAPAVAYLKVRGYTSSRAERDRGDALLAEAVLSCRQARERHSRRGVRHVVEPEVVAET